MTLNGLIGRRGHLQDIQQFWIVGRFILISVLARDVSRACLAAERMFLLNPPPWYLRSIIQDLEVIKHKIHDSEECNEEDESEVLVRILFLSFSWKDSVFRNLYGNLSMESTCKIYFFHF